MNLSHLQFHRNEKEAMNYTDQVKADAKAAADYIREHGWCQGDFSVADGSCCAAGARNAAIYGDPFRIKCGRTLEQGRRRSDLTSAFVIEAGIPCDTTIPEWNDTPGRTKEEVLAVFDRIANS